MTNPFRSNTGSHNEFVVFLLGFFLLLALSFNIFFNSNHQFDDLARAFLQGKTYFLEEPQHKVDTVFFDGHYYWPLGPFPAVLFLPFVVLADLFGFTLHSGIIQFLFTLGITWLVYKITRKLGFNKDDSLFSAFAFLFSSMFMWPALWSAYVYFPHVITSFFIFSAIFEYLHKRRYLLIGLWMGIAMATRFTAGLGIVFFGLELLFSKLSTREKLQRITSLGSLFSIIFLLLGLYNIIRFGHFLDQGYAFQLVSNTSLQKALEYGLLGFVHLPGNLYYAFLSTPLPVFKDAISHVLTFPFIKANPYGMSIFFTSPYLLYLFLCRYRDKTSRFLLIAITVVAIPILLYYGLGYRQLGYRYGLDFMPFLFFLFLLKYREHHTSFSSRLRMIIIVSACVNLYLFFTLILRSYIS